MNVRTISNIYDKLMRMDCGTRSIKFDLHIHSPGSTDFILCGSELDSYSGLLDEVLANHIEIIAITDHNTFRGFNYIKNIIKSDRTGKYSHLLVLCGIEITCFSKHLLAIFDSEFPEEKQRYFLNEIGIAPEVEGTEDALADIYGPVRLLQKIDDYGGIALLAHANTSKGFLYLKCRASGEPESELNFTGKSLANILNSSNLYGIRLRIVIMKIGLKIY